jgi:dTDP-4-dehydrorhamnose reductase
VPVLYFSTDYVFDGLKGEAYVESDSTGPQSVYGRTKLAGEREIGDGWVARSSWLFAPWGKNFVLTMLALGRERDEVSVVDDQRGCPTYVGHLAEATRELVGLPYGTYHVAADGDCTWAELAEAVFEETGIDCRVRRVTTEELGRPAPRPAYSVLRSEKPETPRLPHWRQGLRDCLARLSA